MYFFILNKEQILIAFFISIFEFSNRRYIKLICKKTKQTITRNGAES
jgi:hypothetical protein